MLLVILIVFVFCLSSYVSSVNIRYSAGDYNYVNNDKSRYKRISMPPSGVVMIENISNCLIVVSDSLRVEFNKDDIGNFSVSSISDTARIVADASPVSMVLLYLPTESVLLANSCRIQMKGSLHHNSQPSYRVNLKDSKLLASGEGLHAFINELEVTGNGNAGVEVSKYFHIQSLALNDVDTISLAQGWQIGMLKTNFVRGHSSEMLKAGDSVFVAARKAGVL